MNDKSTKNKVDFYDLQWDTDFFGVTCAKAILYKPLRKFEWNELKEKFAAYEFVSIENRNCEPSNTRLIGKDTNAVLADVNIQFKKNLKNIYETSDKIKIYKNMKLNKQIIDIADFKISKFMEDPELVKRGGLEVYHQWVINSFGKSNKYFAIAKGDDEEINGFLLYSYSYSICTVELIATLSNMSRRKIGTKLFRCVEYSAYQHGCYEIRVGTQVRNMPAINFYHKIGCKQVGCHQIYHLWNC